ncbi:MAG: hypothetical protein LBM77_04515 [Spirochaetaceae bacterium]|jgi:multiple sugar transport system substrate-binding protein/putative aldouronate transport system substrate-binding protein|nr:hypothetical protein [Spirochaetaceae bacterium]
MKKSLLVLASLLVVVSIAFVGCQKSGGSSTAASSGTTYTNGAPVSAADPIDPAKFPYANAEPMTITIFDVAANKMGDQTGWFGDVVKRRFNVTLNIIAPQTQGATLYQTRAASGYLGDIVVLDPSPLQESIDAGLISDLTNDMPKTQYLKEYMDQYTWWNKQLGGNSAGKIWAFPTEIMNTSLDSFVAQTVYIVPRLAWDYFKAVGAPKMKDEYDLLNTIKLIVDKFPTNATGDKTYGVELWPDWDAGNYLEPAVQLMRWFGWYSDPAYNSVQLNYESKITDLLDDNGGYLRALKFFNKANQMGLLDPDSATQTWEGGMVPKMSAKQVVLFMYSWQNGFWNTPARDNEGSNYMYTPVDDLRFYQDGDAYYGTARAFAIGRQNGKELDPAKRERTLALLDWLVSPECMTFQHSGLPSVTIDGKTIEGSYTIAKGSDGKDKYTLTDWGASALMDNLPTPAEWGGVGYNDGLSMINQWMMHSEAISPITGEGYASANWSSTLKKAQESKTTGEWVKKYGHDNEVKYMQANGQLSVVPRLTPVFPTDATSISVIRGQTGQQVVDGSWKMVFAKSDAEFNSLLATLRSTLKGVGWDDLVKNDLAKAQKIVDMWADAKK